MASERDINNKSATSASPINISGSFSSEYSRAKADALNTEFIYYSSSIRMLAPALSRQTDRERVIPWLKKLFGPEYHAERFREKRNRYLLHLILTLMNDGLFGIFRKPPPCGALPDVEDLVKDYRPEPKEWEVDRTWEEMRSDLVEVPRLDPLGCTVHTVVPCPKLHEVADKLLDEMFRYFLYLLRPCAALFNCPENKTKVTAWMQLLCRVGPEACTYMKGVRNDYIMALYSYASDLRIAGMFQHYPPRKMLVSLPRAIRRYAESHPLMDPTSPEANAFLQNQPVPKTGAFCYVALTGQVLHASSAADSSPATKKTVDIGGTKKANVTTICS